jgi:hypothetical protein
LTDLLVEPDTYNESGVGSSDFRKALAAFVVANILQDVEDEHLPLFTVLVEDLVAREFSKVGADVANVNSVMRDNTCGAVVFINAYLNGRSDCKSGMVDFLEEVVKRTGDQDAYTSPALVQAIVLTIVHGLNKTEIPNGVRIINEQIRKYAPEERCWRMVGGFFVLRYLNPCLLNINHNNVWVIVARLLQYLANNSLLLTADGEAHNDFLRDNFPLMAATLASLCWGGKDYYYREETEEKQQLAENHASVHGRKPDAF